MRARSVGATALCLMFSSTVFAQVRVEVSLPGLPPPPTVTFVAPPQLVEVEPGVQVVPDAEEEIFYVENAYWVRRGRFWYRSDDWRGGWVPYRGGPRAVVRYKPGRYRGWHPRARAVVPGPPGAPAVVVRPGRPHRGGPVVVAPPPPPPPGRVIITGPGPGRGHGHGKRRHGED